MAEVFDGDLWDYLNDNEPEDFFNKADRLHDDYKDEKLEEDEETD